MINVTIKNDYIEISGHAKQNEYGKDIVCASVSTAIIMTINQVDLCGLLDNITYKLDEGLASITIIKETTLLRQIIDNLVYSLTDLSNTYPKYLKIDKK